MSLLEEIIELEENFKIKKRVRSGGKKIQRRFKQSKNKAFSINNKTGKKRKITPSERVRRKRSQRIAAKKRMSGRSLAKVRRKISMRKRKNLGFDSK